MQMLVDLLVPLSVIKYNEQHKGLLQKMNAKIVNVLSDDQRNNKLLADVEGIAMGNPQLKDRPDRQGQMDSAHYGKGTMELGKPSKSHSS